MKCQFFAMVLLLTGLAGCNLPGTPAEGNPATPTMELQITSLADLPTSEATRETGEIVPVPTSTIEIEGVAYTAYQMPGDPFRFVCQDPCPLDRQYILAAYAGFRFGHARLIELTGVDTLVELQPVDMHLVLEDSVCSELPVGHAYVYSDKHQAYTCTDGPGYYPTIEEKTRMAARLDGQYFPLHEYMHTIFFGRISGKAGDYNNAIAYFFHDYVVPVPAFATGDLDPARFCTYGDDELRPGDYGGALIVELCRQNGFQITDLALSLIELDALYQSGGGQDYQEGYEHPVPSVAQYRDILNGLLGSDTTNAFAEACWPPELFGNSFPIPPACVVPVSEGTATPLK